MRFVLWLALFALVNPARAEYYVHNNRGGNMYNFAHEFDAIEMSGERVRIRGECDSSCTIVLKLLASGRLCAEPNAKLGFHLAFDMRTNQVDAKDTADLISWYPPAVRTWIRRRGGLTQKLKYLEGKELFALVPRCETPMPPSAREAFADINGVSRPLLERWPVAFALPWAGLFRQRSNAAQ